MTPIVLIGNAWFQQHWARYSTPEFENWWFNYYGQPTDYDAREEEQTEYWVRCSFALKGWLAAKAKEVY